MLLAVAIMMSGALVAAAGDLSFNAWGYAAVFTTDALTAANLVLLKRHPVARELDTALLLFYNSLISLGPIAIAAVLLGDVQRAAAFTGSTSLGFRVSFAACVCLGLSTSHSTYMCTRANEPLTTTVAGSLKNVLMTVIGAFAFGDYSYRYAQRVDCFRLCLSCHLRVLYVVLSLRAARFSAPVQGSAQQETAPSCCVQSSQRGRHRVKHGRRCLVCVAPGASQCTRQAHGHLTCALTKCQRLSRDRMHWCRRLPCALIW